MVQEKRMLDQELRQEVTKTQCFAMMDYLMVQFSDKKDFHYNYYFDTEDGSLGKRDITLRLRTIVKDENISYHLTLKIPTIDSDTYLEYNQGLGEKEMRLLAYNNKLPKGEIYELTSIHGGNVKLVNMIKVNRVFGLFLEQKVFFDRISHQGEMFYEVGTRIDRSQAGDDSKEKNFTKLLKKFGIEFEQAERRSKKFK